MTYQITETGRLVVVGDPSRELFLFAFWQWVGIFAAGDDQRTMDALFWESSPRSSELLSLFRKFWGGAEPWHVIVPNQRLVGVVNDAAETEFPAEPSWHAGAVGWGLAQVPVTTTPHLALHDDVVLMGVAVSFFVRQVPGGYALQYEIVHI